MKNSIFFILLMGISGLMWSQQIPYGANPEAGKYITIGDAKLYYEVYGEGPPLLLLHGDVFGYIDEFGQYIPKLAETFKVIAVGMRGHGKSEIGDETYSYRLFAHDAITILRKESQERATVWGFSAGAITAYYLAAYYPKDIRKVVAMGGTLNKAGYSEKGITELCDMDFDNLMKTYSGFLKSRQQLMPEPDRYPDLIGKLKDSWMEETYVSAEKAKAIRCPILTVAGDRDHYFRLGQFTDIHETIPRSQLAIIPNCDHIGLILRPNIFESIVLPFLRT